MTTFTFDSKLARQLPTRTRFVVLLSAAVLLAASACRSKHDPPLVDQLNDLQQQSLEDTATNVPLPLVRHADAWRNAPVIKTRAERLLVDEIPSGLVADLASEPRALLAVLENKRTLWQQINPNEPFPGEAIVAVPRDLPGSTLLQLHKACTKAGFPHLFVAVHDVSTDTQPVRNMKLVRLRVGSTDRPNGNALRITSDHGVTLAWDGGSANIDVRETRDPAGALRFEGVWDAVKERGEPRVVRVEGAERLTVEQIVGLADTLREHQVEISLSIP